MSGCHLCGQALDTFPCPASWDSEHRRSESPAGSRAPANFFWSARHWAPMLSIAEHLGDRESVRILIEHGIHAAHCGDWETLAWPCPTAVDTLNFIVEETP